MFVLSLVTFALVPFLAVGVVAQDPPAWKSDPFEPAAIPLAVRTPYLSAWLAGGHALPESWPTLYQGAVRRLGWAGYVRVDATAYRTMGLSNVDGQQVAQQTAVKITASSSEFTLTVGSVELLYTFLSPVELGDLSKQSLPLSYFTVSARSTDGSRHTVEVYADISAEWVSGDAKNLAKWGFETGADGKSVSHRIQRQDEQVFNEINDHAEHGAMYFSTVMTPTLSYSQGEDVAQRTNFVTNGKLDGNADTEYRAIGDRWPVFAFADTLSPVEGDGKWSNPIVFSLGHFRDPVIQYVAKTGAPQQLAPYWLTVYKTPVEAISFFLNDYKNAVLSAESLNNKITQDAAKGVQQLRCGLEVLASSSSSAMEFAVPHKADGSLDSTDIMAFQKEISSSSNVNTVDVMFPFWPLVTYSNPKIGVALLEPLLRYAAMGVYPNHWAVHDIGRSYPNATGHNDGKDEPMPIEETANMLILALSAAQKSKDNTQIKKYFTQLDGWAQYLVATTLLPAQQLSTDDFSDAIANHTNLAAKGIVGIAAMGEIAKLTGDAAKAEKYSAIAKDMVPRWRALATSRDRTHLRLTYNDDASSGLMYNLYADKLLGLNLFPDEVYNMQNAFYKTKVEQYGIVLDTRANYTKSDWELWIAAIADKDLQISLVDAVARYSALTTPPNQGTPFGDWYDIANGASKNFRARPVVGGHFAILALTYVSLV
ncbi:DUF1793-domain-containing protein [Auriculariales sp. MPI-PUGE-AT-0066]|nr:DUF1793-domain-containing protein [Auriculariales sp. MPI-PUGE-AT-0066]